MKKILVCLAVAIIAGAAGGEGWSKGPVPQKRKPDVTIDATDAIIAPDDPFDELPERIVYLNQNWDQNQREEFYTLTQGSRLIPYEWFLYLEQASNVKPFRNASNMNRYRYLPQKKGLRNPDGLPVGFVKDPKDVGEKVDWLGFTCAACHTAQVHFEKIAYRIDGASAMADHDQFLIDLTAALKATATDNAKFERFAKNVLGPNMNAAAPAAMKSELVEFAKVRELYNARNKSDVRYGYARLDAFGRIMNEVMTRHVGLGNENAQSPNAPVSYPHLWDTPRYDRVQWNGVAQNTKLFGSLGRNTGEVLGVFGSVAVPGNKLDPRFQSSVNIRNLRSLEQAVGKLWSPLWPMAFGDLNAAKVKAGKELFKKKCSECHTSDVNPEDADRKFTANLLSLKKAGTDPRMAENFVKRTGRAGNLQGRKFYDPSSGILTINKEEKAGILLLAIVNGTILGADRSERIALLEEALQHLKGKVQNEEIDFAEAIKKGAILNRLILSATLPDKTENLKLLNDELMKVIGGIHGAGESDPPLHYKAGSLNGVWATAPYLHNGSVPNLWELLLPYEERTKKFEVGSREFDPKHVGFKSSGYEAKGGFVFDAKLDGNLNKGHDYDNKALSDDDRWALIEYMKSL